MANIEFERNGKTYKLGFTTKSIMDLEKKGAKFMNIDERNCTSDYELFMGSFEAYHKNVPMAEREEIYKEMSVGGETAEDNLNLAIAKLFLDAVNDITRPQGNLAWKIV